VQIDGIYGFVYSGANGLGIGVFRLKDGQIVGHDYARGSYNGAATANADGSIDLELTMQVPAGGELVQGTAAQDIPYQRQIKHRFPPGFGDGEPVRVQMPPGEIIVMVKRIPDGFEEAATNGFTIQTAVGLAQRPL
jgi:hypothetical protein